MFVMREVRQMRIMSSIIVAKYRGVCLDILIPIDRLQWMTSLDGDSLSEFQSRAVIEIEHAVDYPSCCIYLIKVDLH